MTARPAPTLDLERELAARSGRARAVVVGLDEVGRGALAGPVAVGACALRLEGGHLTAPLPEGIRDSKLLTARRRATLESPIREAAAASAIGWAEPAEIDAVGIMEALTRAALRALDGLALTADAIILDGNVDVIGPRLRERAREASPDPTHPQSTSGPAVTLRIGADRTCLSVAAASILAKVARDTRMARLDEEAPDYGWARNKGYGAAAHREALRRLGAHPQHRRSWNLGLAPHPRRTAPPAQQEPAGPDVLWSGETIEQHPQEDTR